MHVIVIGAGVVGVATAYFLAEQGYTVTVIERAPDVASATSFANACQLSYSFTDSLANPGFLRQLPQLLRGRDRGCDVRMSPALASWGVHFLRQCTSKRARSNMLTLLAMALRSQELLGEIRHKLRFDFGYRSAGKLVLLPDTEALEAAERNSELKRQHGSDARVLNRDQAIELEPALRFFDKAFVGATYSAGDEVGDARLFSIGLQKHLHQSGRVEFRFSTEIKSLHQQRHRVSGVVTTGLEAADAVVACPGAWSRHLLRPVGINPRIYPVRGYSVTLPLGPQAPFASVSATRERIVYSRIGNTMRIAGFADFAGFRTAGDSARIGALLDVARKVAPQAANYEAEEKHCWGGFRPMTPTGLPLTGASRLPGLYLNTGHGMLGWTLACASAFEVARAVVAGSDEAGAC
jgi:D-amino-acid dehydrogenase